MQARLHASRRATLAGKLTDYAFSFGHAALLFSRGDDEPMRVLNICNPATGCGRPARDCGQCDRVDSVTHARGEPVRRWSM